MDAFHAFLAAQQQPKSTQPPKADAPTPPEPAHIALIRHWRAEWQAERRAATPPADNDPATNPEFAALVARLNRMAERLHNPPPPPAQSPDEAEEPFPLPPPGYAYPPPRRVPDKNPIPEGAWLIHDENGPVRRPERIPRITVTGKGEGQGRGSRKGRQKR